MHISVTSLQLMCPATWASLLQAALTCKFEFGIIRYDDLGVRSVTAIAHHDVRLLAPPFPQTLRLQGVCRGHTSEITALKFLESYPLLIAADAGGTIAFW